MFDPWALSEVYEQHLKRIMDMRYRVEPLPTKPVRLVYGEAPMCAVCGHELATSFETGQTVCNCVKGGN